MSLNFDALMAVESMANVHVVYWIDYRELERGCAVEVVFDSCDVVRVPDLLPTQLPPHCLTTNTQSWGKLGSTALSAGKETFTNRSFLPGKLRGR